MIVVMSSGILQGSIYGELSGNLFSYTGPCIHQTKKAGLKNAMTPRALDAQCDARRLRKNCLEPRRLEPRCVGRPRAVGNHFTLLKYRSTARSASAIGVARFASGGANSVVSRSYVYRLIV